VRAHRGLGVRVAGVTPLRVFISRRTRAYIILSASAFLWVFLGFGFINGAVLQLNVNIKYASNGDSIAVYAAVLRFNSWWIIGIGQGIQQCAGVERL